MPELPEVHTTAEGIKKYAVGKTILDVWSDFHIGSSHGERETLKNKKYFEKFKKEIKGKKIIGVERRGKNILIHIRNGLTIVIHMKMTGHIMYGRYMKKNYKNNFSKKAETWVALDKGPLQDPFNKFVHLAFTLQDPSNSSGQDNKHLVMSDMRKFASVTYTKTKDLHLHHSVGLLGPEPFDKNFTPKIFEENLNKVPKWPVKSALLNQELVAGIGNIYSDEILWETSIHPLSEVKSIPKKKFEEMFKTMRKILLFSIKVGGDSKSDYRNILGERGGFQNFHKVYGKNKHRCPKKGCGGIIERKVVKGRSAHYCPIHQRLYEHQKLHTK